MTEERLAVNPERGLEPIRDTSYQPQNKVIRGIATGLSFLFHPLFVPVYVAWFLVWTQPQMFAGFDAFEKKIVILRFFVTYTMFPLVTVLLLKGLGFIGSVQLKTRRDRIIPYISTNIFYFSMAWVMRNQPEFAHEVTQFVMAIFIASSIGLLMNIYLKISMHAIGMGIVLAFIGMLAVQIPGLTNYLSITLLITGLVCTARMIVSDHTSREIYLGLIVGIGSMLLGIWADGILP